MVLAASLAAPAPIATTARALTAPGVPPPTGASRLVALPPTRLVDTRDGVGTPVGPVGDGATISIAVAGHGGVPANGATAVVLNATVTDTSAAGYLTIWPGDAAQPTVSNVNATAAGQTVANLAVVRLGADGTLKVFAQRRTNVVLDVAGYFTAAAAAVADGRFVPLTPARVLDTREGLGAAAGKRRAGSVTDIVVAGHGGVPTDGASAVALTLTATEAVGAGYVTAWPAGQDRPLASNLNLRAGATVANVVILPVGADGAVSLFNQSGAHLVADVVGWFTGADAAPSTDGLFVPLTPRRALDTRVTGDRLDARFRRDLRLGLGGAAAVVGNLTITDTATAMYLTAYPGRTGRPFTSNLNADGAGITRANLALVPVTAGDRASVYVTADTDLVVDLAGWFTGQPLPIDPNVADVAPAPSGDGGADAADFIGLDAAINTFLADTATPHKSLAGASVAVARNGRVVHARSFGTGNVATGEPVRVDSRFRIASESKTILAATVVRLAEQGALSLDQPVWPLIDGRVPLPAGADPRANDITVRNLLTHSSGFLTWLDPLFNEQAETVAQFGPAGPTSCEQAAGWFLGTWPLAYAPGTKYGYTNLDYCLLGIVVEAVTGEPWWQVENEQVLRPRGIVDVRPAHTRGDHLVHEIVHDTPAPDAVGGGWFMETLGGAGALVGTAVDLVRFLDGLDASRPGTDLVGPATLSAMTAKPTYAKPEATVWYGQGLIVYGDGANWGHTGSLHNARGMMLHRSDGTTFAILFNGTFDKHADEMANLMTAALATVSHWPTVDLSPDLP